MNRTVQPWGYLHGLAPAPNAPVVDNPSGLYCEVCREAGISHCSEPEYCGEMRPMRPITTAPQEGNG